jgi:nucleoside-diphosphate-sugar epimerase
MRVLVTGATGFVGSHVADALVRRGDEVHGITRLSTGGDRAAGLAPSISWHEVDPDDTTALLQTVHEIGPEAAVHLGWYAQPGVYLNDSRENLRSLRTTTSLLEALLDARCPRVVLAGSGLETVAPTTIYAAAKASAHLIAAQLRRDGVAATCAHIFYTYGPRENARRVIPTVIRSLLRGEPVAVGDGSETRDYVHVADVAEAFSAILERDLGPSVDICTGRTVHLRDVFEVIGRQTGQAALIRPGERRTSAVLFPETGDPVPLQALGWKPAIGLEDGIRDAIAYWMAELPAQP